MVPQCGLEGISRADTVVVPPTERLALVPPAVLGALRRAHARGCRIVSLCTGAFILAEAGMLDGRRATTHWSECDELARRYPHVTVDPGVLYVDGGDILTSAGSAASIDLCLHVVRQDYGSAIANRLARLLVVPPQRDGGQAQLIDNPVPSFDSSDMFADTLTWVQEHLHEVVTVNDLAALRHEPSDVCAPVPRLHGYDAAPMATAPARPSCAATPRVDRPVHRGGGTERRVLHGRKSP
jgi:AraC family transcriptional activator FtrA